MKKAKIAQANKKEETVEIDESYSLKSLIKIILIIVLVFAIFYFLTTLIAKKSENNNNYNSATIIDSSKITLNHLLDRSEKEYYVIATKESLYSGLISNANYIEIYNKYIKDYSNSDESLKFYTVDLDDAFNKNYIGDSTNITDDLKNLRLSDEVLFKISNNKIEKYYIGSEQIIKALSELQ